MPKQPEQQQHHRQDFAEPAPSAAYGLRRLAPMSDERTMRERMLAGEPYIADDPALARDVPARPCR